VVQAVDAVVTHGTNLLRIIPSSRHHGGGA
jgi:hypothetical protein